MKQYLKILITYLIHLVMTEQEMQRIVERQRAIAEATLTSQDREELHKMDERIASRMRMNDEITIYLQEKIAERRKSEMQSPINENDDEKEILKFLNSKTTGLQCATMIEKSRRRRDLENNSKEYLESNI